MKAKGNFIAALLVIDAFFIAFAYGFNSRKVMVVDPNLPPVHVRRVEKAPVEAATQTPPSNPKTPLDKPKSVEPTKAKKTTAVPKSVAPVKPKKTTVTPKPTPTAKSKKPALPVKNGKMKSD